MKPDACYNGKGDGSRKQAEIWQCELERQGHQVDLINPWGSYQWKSYDIVHFYGIGLWDYDMIRWGSGLNKNIVFSPIIDSNTPLWKYRMFSHIGCEKLRLFSQNYAVRCYKDHVKLFLARTQYEASYLSQGYGISQDKIGLVPLSYREDHYNPDVKKEPFCLFTGTMTQERKNVPRLIEAAKKYEFHLVLAGSLGNSESEARLRSLIGDAPNIEVKLVALEAAVHGCNIVITKLGGPKEYYREGTVWLVDPYSVDDIGRNIRVALQVEHLQPDLRNEIIQKYSVSHCVHTLLKEYEKVCINDGGT